MKMAIPTSMIASIILLTAGFCSSVLAQSDASQEVIAAINQLEKDDSTVFTGEISTGNDDDVAGGGIGVIVIGGGPMAGSEFDEPFELTYDSKKKDLLICSKNNIPGVSIYSDGDEQIKSTTYRDEPLAIDTLATDLTQFFDLESLKKYVGRCKDIKTKEKKNGTVYQCELSSRLIRTDSGGGPMEMMAPKILNISADFHVGNDGKLSSIEVCVTRKNPMAAMMDMGGAVDVQGGFGDDPEIQAQLDAQMSKNPEVIYSLERKKDGVSKRTQKMLDLMRALSGEI